MIGRTNAVIGGGSKWPSADDVQVTYTGEMAEPREITDAAGNKYVLYELTSSGTLTVDKEVIVDLCVVSGGCGGNNYSGGSTTFHGVTVDGGHGGGMFNITTAISGSVACAVGNGGAPQGSGGYTAPGTSSVIISEYLTVEPDLQGTGGGRGGGSYLLDPGKYVSGDGKSKYVFGDNSVYDYPICAGGGGGPYVYISSTSCTVTPGANGASNGLDSEGTPSVISQQFDYPVPMASGGENGGGNSAYRTEDGTTVDATDGSTYGSGGGSCITYSKNGAYYKYGNGGAGRQGVIFIRILK